MKASFGVDRVVKSSCKAPVIKLDLTDPQGEALAQSYLCDRNCKYSHFGIPCGTCSRAREIPIEGEANAPKPLRSPEFPEGLPNLEPRDQERVDLANKVYSACARLIITCIVLSIRWTLEQPSRSLFWLTKYWRWVLDHCQPLFVSFHNCMFGGARPKRTTIATDIEGLHQLECECNGQHAHLPWGRTPYGFATASEVEYPLSLCKQWASIVFDAVMKQHKPRLQHLPANPDKKARHLAQKQTRKSISFMPEFSHVATANGNGPPPITVGHKLANPVEVGTAALPIHSRILRISKTRDETGGSDPVFQVAYGVPWTIETFIAEAIQRGHPVNLFDGMAPSLQRAIDANASWDPDKIVIQVKVAEEMDD
eukprot:s4507_g3.t1